MKTILVPTDFSDPSKVAVMYAAQLAIQLEAAMALVSVVNVNATPQTLMKWEKLEEAMLDIAQQDAEQLMNEIQAETANVLNISYHSLKGFPFELVMERFVSENEVDLIVLGTKGATGLKKALLGSNATAVIDHSSVPVLAVPGDAEFNGVKRIIYATDMISLHAEIQTIAMYAARLQAEICILHVLPTDSATKVDTKKKADEMINITKYPAISFQVLYNDHIGEAVEAFFTDQRGDLLAMFTHKLDFYEKLFGKSVTQKLAFHAKIPLLAFNKTMVK